MSKWDRFQSSASRLHTDFNFPVATFRNYTQTGIENGQPTGDYDTSDTADVEIVPPQADGTVDTEGTHLGFSTSIRAPQADIDGLTIDIVDYGDDGERPTRVDILNETYEVQSKIPEDGSDMYLMRLTEV